MNEWNYYYFQETSFASNQPVTRSLSSIANNNKLSKLPLPTSTTTPNGISSSKSNGVNNQNRINTTNTNTKKKTKTTDLERISPWLVSSDAISTKKEKEKSKIPQLKTVITTELWWFVASTFWQNF